MSESNRPRRPPDRRPAARQHGLGPDRDDGASDECAIPSLTVDRRAVSKAVDYTLGLAIASVVITGLFIGITDFVGDQRESVARTELRVIGERIANDVTAADRLAEAGSGSPTVVVNQSLPERITGVGYTVTTAEESGTQWVNVSMDSPEVSVSVQVDTATPLAERSIKGGDVSVVYTGSALEVRA